MFMINYELVYGKRKVASGHAATASVPCTPQVQIIPVNNPVPTTETNLTAAALSALTVTAKSAASTLSTGISRLGEKAAERIAELKERNKASLSATEEEQPEQPAVYASVPQESEEQWVFAADQAADAGLGEELPDALPENVASADMRYEKLRRRTTTIVICSVLTIVALCIAILAIISKPEEPESPTQLAAVPVVTTIQTTELQTTTAEATTVTEAATTDATTVITEEAEPVTTPAEPEPEPEPESEPMPILSRDWDIWDYPEYVVAVENLDIRLWNNEFNYYGVTIGQIGYTLIDLNEDNTPELLLIDRKYKEVIYEIYTSIGKEAVLLGQSAYGGGAFSSDLFMCSNNIIMCSSSGGASYYTEAYYKYNGGNSLDEIDEISTEDTNCYDINHNLISEKEAEKIRNKYGAEQNLESTSVSIITRTGDYEELMEQFDIRNYDIPFELEVCCNDGYVSGYTTPFLFTDNVQATIQNGECVWIESEDLTAGWVRGNYKGLPVFIRRNQLRDPTAESIHHPYTDLIYDPCLWF